MDTRTAAADASGAAAAQGSSPEAVAGANALGTRRASRSRGVQRLQQQRCTTVVLALPATTAATTTAVRVPGAAPAQPVTFAVQSHSATFQ